MKISVVAKTRAKEEKVEKREDKYIVYVKEQPIKNKANRAIIKVLAEYFSIPKSHISIVSGLTLKQKIVKISDDKT
ncbi:MAG: DUF167 domain-containing protein [bacterium]